MNKLTAKKVQGKLKPGMHNDGASPALTNVIFLRNFAAVGAGIFNGNGSSPTITGATFSSNSAGWTRGKPSSNVPRPVPTQGEVLHRRPAAGS